VPSIPEWKVRRREERRETEREGHGRGYRYLVGEGLFGEGDDFGAGVHGEDHEDRERRQQEVDR